MRVVVKGSAPCLIPERGRRKRRGRERRLAEPGRVGMRQEGTKRRLTRSAQ